MTSQPRKAPLRPGRLRLAAVLALLSVGYLSFLAGITVYSADDFWYSTFLNGGFQEYIRLMIYHYREFNGRVLVHIAAHVILHFGTVCFAGCVALVMAGMPLLLPENAPRILRLLLFCLGVLFLPRAMMVEGLLWISAFCNYVLSTALVLLQLHMLFRFVRQGGRISAGICCLLSFLCGATTEQSGFVAVCVAVYAGICCLPQQRKRVAVCAVSAACAALGLLSIFASPATRSRMATESSGSGVRGMLHSIKGGVAQQTEYFFRFYSLQLFVILLFLAAAWLLYRQGKRPLAAAAGTLGIMGAFLITVGRVLAPLLAYAGVCLCLLALAAVLWFWGRRQLCALVLCGLASLAILLPTTSSSPRTMLPCGLYLLLVLSSLGAELLLASRKGQLLLLALFGAAAVTSAAQLPGYWNNFQVEQLNREYVRQARETHTLYYCLDYNMAYTHTKAHTDGYFYRTYLESTELDLDNTAVYVYGQGCPLVYVEGKRTISPAIASEDGGYLLPLRDIVETLGGTVDASNGVHVSLNGKEYLLQRSYGVMYLTWTDDQGQEQTQAVECPILYYAACLPQWVYTDIFGLEVNFDAQGEEGTFLVSDSTA